MSALRLVLTEFRQRLCGGLAKSRRRWKSCGRAAGWLALDADHGKEPGDFMGEPGVFRGVDHRGNVLVGAWRLLGYAARGRTAHDDPAAGQLVDDLPARPLLER